MSTTARTAPTAAALPELRQILNVPESAMDHAMGFAYQLYLAGRYEHAASLCQALIACDRRYWWPHSLLAAALRRLDRPDEALVAVNEGLKYEPRQPKLLLMRDELLITLARRARFQQEEPPAHAAASDVPTLKLALG